MAYEFYLADSSLYAVVTPAVRRECYEAFKQKHGSKTDQILESFREFQIARNGQQQTSGQRKQVFKKAETKLVELVSAATSITLHLSCLNKSQVDSLQELHGFAAVVALIGNVVNSDSGLAMVHETKNALGVCFQPRETSVRLAQILTRACRSSSRPGAEVILTKS